MAIEMTNITFRVYFMDMTSKNQIYAPQVVKRVKSVFSCNLEIFSMKEMKRWFSFFVRSKLKPPNSMME